MSSPLYAGIGSRATPGDTLSLMRRIAARLANHGFMLRSGAADGADAAFEAGCRAADGVAEIWLPWPGFNGHEISDFMPGPAHIQLASEMHPAWQRLSRGPRLLHARNTGQILGADLQTPVHFVVCWTPDGAEHARQTSAKTGGTGTAIRIADRAGVPVFNLRNVGALDRLGDLVRGIVVESPHHSGLSSRDRSSGDERPPAG